MAQSSREQREGCEMIIDMATASPSSVLAGTSDGRRWFMELMEKTKDEPPQPEPVYLDFNKIEVATASFLREAVLELRDTLRRRRSNWYPIPANCRATVAEELRMLVENSNTALTICELRTNGSPNEARLLGVLDPKQKHTFQLVQRYKEVDATTLADKHSNEEGLTAPTAWNNRLASLVKLGLIVELPGRPKKYRALMQESE